MRAYESQVGLDAVILRYFSVYGPRQRPDMAYNIFCRALLEDAEIKVFGDGGAVRSNTFVDDCVRGTIQALRFAPSGEVFNSVAAWLSPSMRRSRSSGPSRGAHQGRFRAGP